MTKTMSLLTTAALITGAGAVSVLHAGEPFAPTVGKGVITGGYDEGLACHYYLSDKLNVYGAIGFYMKGESSGEDFAKDSTDILPSQIKSKIKVGSEYQLYQKDRFMVNGFGEYKLRLDQGVVEMTSTAVAPNQYYRFNEWGHGFSVGVKPSVFILPQLSLDYKMGLHFWHTGTTYLENEDKTGITKAGDDYNEFGIYSKSEPLWFTNNEATDRSDTSFLFNLTVNYNFKRNYR